MSDILQQLADVLETRKGADPDSSYVAKLYSKGLDSILKKVGEEATETVMAAKDGEHGFEALAKKLVIFSNNDGRFVIHGVGFSHRMQG